MMAQAKTVPPRAVRRPGAFPARKALAVLAGCLLAACSAPTATARSTAVAADGTAATCADGGAALPVTGLCAAEATGLLRIAGGARLEAPEGCAWRPQETVFAGDVLLYLALQCGDRTAQLAFAGGGHMAELSYAATAVFGETPEGMVLVRVGGVMPEDPNQALLANTRDAMDDPAGAANCFVRPADTEGWPADAVVVDVQPPPQAASAEPGDDFRAGCGPLGYVSDSTAYWRVFQGFSWFFDFGQDLQEFDPASFTLVTRGEDGVWRVLSG